MFGTRKRLNETDEMAEQEGEMERYSADDFYLSEDIIGQSTSRTYLTSDRSSPSDSQAEVVERPRNRGTARVVACVAITFIVVCFMMVGASLLMSKDIDSKVRNSNEMLRKHNDRMSGMQGDGSAAGNITGL